MTFSKLSEKIDLAITEFHSKLNESLDSFMITSGLKHFSSANIKDLNADDFKQIGEHVGENGWVVPADFLSMPFGLIQKIYSKINKNDLDEAMTKYFEQNIAEIMQKFENTTLDNHTKELLLQSYGAFNTGFFHPAITSLTAIADGLLDESLKDWDCTKTQFIVRADKLNDEQEHIGYTGLYNFVVMVSLQKFTETYMQDARFNKPEPNIYNRHWVMHGRGKRPLTKKDYFQIFSFINALIFIFFRAELEE